MSKQRGHPHGPPELLWALPAFQPPQEQGRAPAAAAGCGQGRARWQSSLRRAGAARGPRGGTARITAGTQAACTEQDLAPDPCTPPGQGLFLFKEISLATFPALKPKLADKTNTCKWPRLGF